MNPNIFSSIALVCTITLFTIPYWDLKEIYRTKETDKFPYLLFVNFAIQCYFWAWYGILISSTSVILCNSYGLVTNTGFIIVFILCTNLEENYKKAIIGGIIVVIGILLYISFSFQISKSIYGSIALVFNILAMLSSGQKIRDAMEHKDISYIPIKIVLIVLLNSSMWMIYGILIGWDLFIITPNVIGISVSVFQLYLFKLYDTNNEAGKILGDIKEKIGISKKETDNYPDVN